MITGKVSASSLALAPLPPKQVLDGTPEARSLTLGISSDGNFSCNVWSCSAGRFRWVYYSDEIIHVLEGSATITPQGGGEPRTVGPGDVVYFERGLVVVWEIEDFVKKLAVHRSRPPGLRQRVGGKLRRLSEKLARRG